jgi:hypothetical protein
MKAREASSTIEPLLVDEAGAGVLLGGISAWTVREYIAAGLIPTVSPPSPLNTRRKLRRKLIDVADLRAFIAKHKSGVVK